MMPDMLGARLARGLAGRGGMREDIAEPVPRSARIRALGGLLPFWRGDAVVCALSPTPNRGAYFCGDLFGIA
jgi:hypothetical protein